MQALRSTTRARGGSVLAAPGLHSCLTGLHGSVSGLHGRATGLHGRLTALHGCVTGLHGCLTGLHGRLMGLHGCVTPAPGLVLMCSRGRARETSAQKVKCENRTMSTATTPGDVGQPRRPHCQERRLSPSSFPPFVASAWDAGVEPSLPRPSCHHA